MSHYINKKFEGLEAYTPGEQPRDMQYVKLNTNESPFPPSEGVVRAVSADEVSRLNLYPDPTCKEQGRRMFSFLTARTIYSISSSWRFATERSTE